MNIQQNSNSRIDIDLRNEIFFKYLGISKNDFFNRLIKIGKPLKFGDGKWSESNPTAGRCGSVVNAIRLANKIPQGYIACGQSEIGGGSHYYFVNPDTKEVIDPTCYQMEDEYNYDIYHKSFFPQVSKNVQDTMKALDLEIDETIFNIKKSTSGVITVSKA